MKKKTYQFILVLKNVDDNTSHLEDSLFEAGCDDASINFRNGTVYLDFDRKANSLEEAVMSAIKDVESASVKPIVINIAPENFVTESDVAKRLNVNRQAVSLWIQGERRKSKPFPHPIMKLADKSPFWKWSEVANWLYENNKTSKEAVENAVFLETMNAVLEERDPMVQKFRQDIFEKFKAFNEISGKGPITPSK